MTIKQMTIYTDGACDGNPGRGGYGVVLLSGGKREEISGGYRLTTNNRMELMAAIVGLRALKSESEVKLYSDSRYLVDAINKEWVNTWESKDWMRKKNERVANADLWGELIELTNKHDVQYFWVRGHAGDRWNERADFLSYKAIENERLQIDEVYESTYEQRSGSREKITKEGQPCRKCGTPVERKKPKRSIKPDQEYYYEFYFKCPECGTVYMVEEAKREVNRLF